MAHVLLITGAGRGIGAATAKLAAGRGYDIAVNYKSDATSAAQVVAAVKAKGRNAVAIAADMEREADVGRMFKEADALGRLTHFVYNAGIPGVAGRLESAASAMMREVIEVNVLGALWSMQHAIRRMSKKRRNPGQLRVARGERDTHPRRCRHAGQARPRRADDPDGPGRPAGGERRGGAVSPLRRRLLHQRHRPARRRRALAHRPLRLLRRCDPPL
jgi:NAD(P)-dependent dehydrogenase (short-subunit alcohol dehydrogenase family)